MRYIMAYALIYTYIYIYVYMYMYTHRCSVLIRIGIGEGDYIRGDTFMDHGRRTCFLLLKHGAAVWTAFTYDLRLSSTATGTGSCWASQQAAAAGGGAGGGRPAGAAGFQCDCITGVSFLSPFLVLLKSCSLFEWVTPP
jgi:hypothetical protein